MRLIDEFQHRLDEIEQKWPMTGSYERIDPYIVPYMQGGDYYELLIYHKESRSWFDSTAWDYIANYLVTRKMVRPGDVAFDLGCNAGAFTVVMARLAGQSGHVHAFDPYPWNAAATQCNARLNYLTNVSSYPVGLSNRDFQIQVGPNDSRSYEHHAAADAKPLEIRSISNYMHLRPRFLKIDIEGAEYDLFEHQNPQVFGSVEQFSLEFHPFYIRPRGLDPRKALAAMEAVGFDLHHYDASNPAYAVQNYVDNHHLFWGVRRAG